MDYPALCITNVWQLNAMKRVYETEYNAIKTRSIFSKILKIDTPVIIQVRSHQSTIR